MTWASQSAVSEHSPRVDQTMGDVQACIDALKGPVFVTGFCYGGSVSWLAAARCTGLTAASCFYGGLIASFVDEQPKVPVILHFGKKDALGMDYDEVWRDRGGIRVADTHFELPIGGNRRPLDEIAAKKRSMYRRRYQMLDEISAALPTDLRQAERRRFEAS